MAACGGNCYATPSPVEGSTNYVDNGMGPGESTDCVDLEFVFARGSGAEYQKSDMWLKYQSEMKKLSERLGYTYRITDVEYPAVSVIDPFTNAIGAYVSAGQYYEFGRSVKAGVPGATIATAAVILPAFLTVIVLMTLLKKLIGNGVFQATLSSLKACVIGIVLATGAYMILINCIVSVNNFSVDYSAIIMTVALGAVYFVSKKIIRNGISPIILICIAGIAGIIVFGR